MTELKFKAGDHVMVPATVEETDEPDGYRLKFDDGFRAWIRTDALASATLIERPLAVGEEAIAHLDGPAITVTILAIDGDMAWIKESDGGLCTVPLSELRRAEERG